MYNGWIEARLGLKHLAMNGIVEKPLRFEEALAVVSQIILLFCELNGQNNNVHSGVRCSDDRLGLEGGLEMEKVGSGVIFPLHISCSSS